MNPYYPPRTPEQKRRKQAVRNWKRAQSWICDWNTKAIECAKMTQQQAFLNNASVARMMFRHIFEDEDKNEKCLYQSDILSERMALAVLD